MQHLASNMVLPKAFLVSVMPRGCVAVQRAAMTQSALSKERRELREQQQRTLLEAIPKDLSRPWEDPLPEAGERHLAQVGLLPLLSPSIRDWVQTRLRMNLSTIIFHCKSLHLGISVCWKRDVYIAGGQR